MSRGVNTFKLGLFVIAMTGLAVAGIIALGAARIFETNVHIETYLNESVQGLEVGSPVKYNGVPIGKVERIGFVAQRYPRETESMEAQKLGGYVLVDVAVDPAIFETTDPGEVQSMLDPLIADGLRLQLTPQGITGVKYLEANRFEPEKAPIMPISWRPRGVYVPSTPSLLSLLGMQAGDIIQGAGNIVAQFEDIKFDQFVTRLNRFLDAATRTVETAGLTTATQEITLLAASVRETNEELLSIVRGGDFKQMTSDAADSVASIRKTAGALEADAPAMLADARSAAAKLRKMLEEDGLTSAVAEAAGAARSLNETSAKLPEALAEIQRTVRTLESAIRAQSEQLRQLIVSAKGATDGLRDLARNASRYPAQALMGEPPPRSRPGGDRK